MTETDLLTRDVRYVSDLRDAEVYTTQLTMNQDVSDSIFIILGFLASDDNREPLGIFSRFKLFWGAASEGGFTKTSVSKMAFVCQKSQFLGPKGPASTSKIVLSMLCYMQSFGSEVACSRPNSATRT